MGAVPNATPAGGVKILPDAAETNGHPLTEERVGVRQLLQAVCYEITLQTGLLVRGGEQGEEIRMERRVGRGREID